MAKRLWSHPLTIFQLPWLALQRLMRGGKDGRVSAAQGRNPSDQSTHRAGPS
jgi:hypothetical protein